ncbi:MAG TPA: hypothetical protein VGV07_11285 [Devosia sp.]|uniref:hypothetical protein n=1 Tax=Devosia sp. TaxID=1871048 RepID=UPI002DDD96A2|nr:hypothetical protein [Devosia sp.]HEV2515825.1 hypothetical protein [Devosia sp.]
MLADFSERVRADARVRPAMTRLVGNRWLEAEQSAEAFMSATLFLDEQPDVDPVFLERAVQLLGPAEIDALAEIMLECAMVAFPLQSAAAITEVTEMLASTVRAVATSEGQARQDQLERVYSRLSAGTLMNRF